jgi:hypothetical protein
MTKETAVQEFNWWVNNHINDLLDGTLGYDEFKQRMEASFVEFKAMEKEQIMMAVKDSWYMAKGSNFQEPQEEQYYNETYGK